MENSTENWGVEDAHGTCSSEGMNEATARAHAKYMTERTGEQFYAVDMSADEATE
jgi:hypothetical protein